MPARDNNKSKVKNMIIHIIIIFTLFSGFPYNKRGKVSRVKTLRTFPEHVARYSVFSRSPLISSAIENGE